MNDRHRLREILHFGPHCFFGLKSPREPGGTTLKTRAGGIYGIPSDAPGTRAAPGPVGPKDVFCASPRALWPPCGIGRPSRRIPAEGPEKRFLTGFPIDTKPRGLKILSLRLAWTEPESMPRRRKKS